MAAATTEQDHGSAPRSGRPVESQGYRGRCLYKTGKCENERAIKTNGQAHNLCDMHRLRQNQNQRKLDGKNRHNRNSAYSPYSRTADIQKGAPPRKQEPSVIVKQEGLLHHSSPSVLPRQASSSSSAHLDYPRPTVSPPLAFPHAPRRTYFPPPPPSSALPASPPRYPPPFTPVGPSYAPSSARAPPLPLPGNDGADDITVPTPSYLKGEAREAFRSRVLQKLVNIISEEVVMTSAQQSHQQPPPTYSYPSYDYAPSSSYAYNNYHHREHSYGSSPPLPQPPSSSSSYHSYEYPEVYHRQVPFQAESDSPRTSSRATSFLSSAQPLPKLQSLGSTTLPPLIHTKDKPANPID
ncbi:hypothetical protein LEN26_013602 [Aphanomyces euteiches]|nr:hypothetical protein AeMF1_018539 [Aphanomyces euteiches]KAH9110885.1 hypothetical protein LEN26_013602 [Aphanomyces euteiches]KAH9189651.1 hypothetical protein AeNC1_008371 [Aphanomyces euteiches]